MSETIHILGISAFYHDSAACLIRDGQIIAAAQEERFTRKKHDFEFPQNAIQYCLQAGGITAADLAYVGFYDKPLLKFERILLTYLAYAPRGVRSFLKAMPLWLKQKLYIKWLILEHLPDFEGEVLFSQHHEAHAASAFLPSPFQTAAVLTMDGVGEWATSSYGYGRDNQISLLGEMHFPHSLGLLYSAFTYYIGFRVNSGEYKLMGLAPYGEPKYVHTIKDNLLDVKPDGSFKLDMSYFNYCAGLTMTTARFHRLFGGAPRKPESALTQRDMDLARSIQDVTEEIMLLMAEHVFNETQEQNLCLAGGVALNCVGNGKILRQSPFKNIWIQPAAGDAGGALGVALYIWHQFLGNPRSADGRSDRQSGSYLGPDFDEQALQAFLDAGAYPYEKVAHADLAGRVAQLIAGHKVLGFFQGRMEFGPRALGARSIIADARSETMQSVLNRKIKFRESFRPFAPSVLEERKKDFFDISCASPYMLLVAQLQEGKVMTPSRSSTASGVDKLKVKRSEVPAVTHVDYSARLQTVDRTYHPVYYDVIKAFESLTGCPVIINTSFNIRGEPIVCTPEDAYRCFMCTDMDYLILGDFILDKVRQPNKDRYTKDTISTILD